METMPRHSFANRRHYRRAASARPPMRLDRNARVRLLIAADTLRRQSRTKGRQGVITPHMIEVLRVLALRLYDPRSATAWPSYDTLAEIAGLGRATIGRAVKALEAAGFLTVERRYRRFFHNSRVLIVRTSNRYGLLMPTPKAHKEAIQRQAPLEHKITTAFRPTKRGAITQASAWIARREKEMADREAETVAAIVADRAAGRI